MLVIWSTQYYTIAYHHILSSRNAIIDSSVAKSSEYMLSKFMCVILHAVLRKKKSKTMFFGSGLIHDIQNEDSEPVLYNLMQN